MENNANESDSSFRKIQSITVTQDKAHIGSFETIKEEPEGFCSSGISVVESKLKDDQKEEASFVNSLVS